MPGQAPPRCGLRRAAGSPAARCGSAGSSTWPAGSRTGHTPADPGGGHASGPSTSDSGRGCGSVRSAAWPSVRRGAPARGAGNCGGQVVAQEPEGNRGDAQPGGGRVALAVPGVDGPHRGRGLTGRARVQREVAEPAAPQQRLGIRAASVPREQQSGRVPRGPQDCDGAGMRVWGIEARRVRRCRRRRRRSGQDPSAGRTSPPWCRS